MKKPPLSNATQLPGAASHSGSDVVRATRIRSSDLLNGSRELIIEHVGKEYRLRLTSNGKLILTA